MDQPKIAIVFALGCAGSLAPEIVRLYQLRRKPPKEVFTAWYYVISALMAFLGGGIALVLPAVTTWAAFYAGVTAPLIVSTAAKRRKNAKVTNMANAKGEVVHGIDHSQQRDTIRAQRSDAFKPTGITRIIELFRNHADGLFL